jgi:5-methyltetrahydrofolate--homocysteine methyltransferase
MSRYLEALNSGHVMLMDGAMGTELRRAGLAVDGCGEAWNLTNSEKVRAIHQAYKDAGARCFLSNTFQSNPSALAKHGFAGKLEAINQAAIELVRSVAGTEGFVLGDIGPFHPAWNEQTVQQIVSSLGGVDGLLLETFSDLDGLWAAKYGCLPCFESDSIPVLLSVTYKRTSDGVLTAQGGQTPEVFGHLARQYGIAALGVNCGREIGMKDIIEIVRRYRTVTDLPLFARPNAGTPVREGERLIYPHSPEQMAALLPDLLEAGPAMIGGCCGTTPDHIAAFRPIIEAWNARLGPGAYI